MISLYNEHEIDINSALLEKIASELTTRAIELNILDDAEMQEVNREYRGKDAPTDVLSFPLEAEIEHLPLGTILISYERAIERSKALGHSFDEEVGLLFLHGVLHLMGYDHEKDSGEQREREIAIINALGLPKSLIVRSEDE